MVSMTDTLEYPNAYSCCMKKSSEYSDVLVDGIHINFILTLIYFGSYAANMQRVCLTAFIIILVNSMYMFTIIYPVIPKISDAEADETEAETEEAEVQEAEAEADEAEADEAEAETEAEKYINLSLKQREHSATRSKSLRHDDDTILYKKLHDIVKEAKRRNNIQFNALMRTPTSSSLAENDNLDNEYADMPPLIDACSISNYENKNNISYNKIPNNCNIPIVREILERPVDMDAVD